MSETCTVCGRKGDDLNLGGAGPHRWYVCKDSAACLKRAGLTGGEFSAPGYDARAAHMQNLDRAWAARVKADKDSKKNPGLGDYYRWKRVGNGSSIYLDPSGLTGSYFRYKDIVAWRISRGLNLVYDGEAKNEAHARKWILSSIARLKAVKGTLRLNPKRRRNPEDPVFGEVIHGYSRKQALEDGELVDVTEWGSSTKGFMGGFTSPVAITRALWTMIEKVPKGSLQDVRGRAHDVLWMASLAVRGGMRRGMISNDKQGGRVGFDVLLSYGRTKKQRLAVDLSPGDKGEPVVTIGLPSDF